MRMLDLVPQICFFASFAVKVLFGRFLSALPFLI